MGKRISVLKFFVKTAIIKISNLDKIYKNCANEVAMSITKSFFLAIDKMYNKRQNPKRLEQTLHEVTTVCDIVYSNEFPDMLLDVNFVPRTDNSAFPVIFEIHGGGFAAGDKKYRRVLSKFYAKQTGAFVVNVNYGLGKENAWPLPMQHLVAAANWVVQNAQNYNLDLSHFVAAGDSAGGYYAAFLCALQNNAELQNRLGCSLSAKFTAGVFNCGLFSFDLAMKRSPNLLRGVCKEFTGFTISEARKNGMFETLSVPNYVTHAFPKSMLIYSEHDIFCKGQAELLMEQFSLHGVYFESARSTKFMDNHDYNLMWKSKCAVLTNNQVIGFINRHFQEDATQSKHTQAVVE